MLKKEVSQRKLDHYFNYYSEKSLTLNSRIIQGICAFGLYFGLLGLSWSIPFPYLQFLGQYNSYFNWASFVIAFSIYYYSKLSPLLSYVMLFLTLVFTYLITILEKQELDNKQVMILTFVSILLGFELVRLISYKLAGKSSTLKMELTFILIGPIWIVHFLLKKWFVRY